MNRPFSPDLSFKMTVSVTAKTKQFPRESSGGTRGSEVTLYNSSATIPVIVAFGDASVVAVVPTSTAAVKGHCIPPAQTRTLTIGREEYISMVTESSTADLYVSTGTGGN